MSTYDPYAALPGPTSYLGTTPVLPPARRRPRGLVVGLVAVVTVAVLGLGTAAAYVAQRLLGGSPDRLVELVPGDAVVYSHVNLRPSASNMLGLVSLADRLEEATGESLLDADRLAAEVGEDEPVWDDDVAPWLGGQAAGFITATPSGGELPEGALLVSVSDRAGAASFVEEHVDTTGPWDAGDGAQGWQLEGDDSAPDLGAAVLALTDDLLVVGTEAAVSGVLAGSDAPLSDVPGYRSLVDELPASVLTTWVDVEALDDDLAALDPAFADPLATQLPAQQMAFGLSLSSGAADVTIVSRPMDDLQDLPESVAPASLADLPAGGLAYVRAPDAGATLARSLTALDEATAGAGIEGPSASEQADEALAAYGTDLATVTGWLGDITAMVAFDPGTAEDNVALLVRAAVSDEASAAQLLDAAAADLPADSGLQVAPGSVAAGSASLAVGDGALTLQLGEPGEDLLADDPAFRAAMDGLAGEPVVYLDVRGLVGAVAPFAVQGVELGPQEQQALDAAAAFDGLVATQERLASGLDRGSVRLTWGQPLQPVDLDAVNPPDVDLGDLGELEDLAGLGAGDPYADDPFADLEGFEGLEGLEGDPGDLGDLGDLEEEDLLGGMPPVDGPDVYGDDPELDALWDGCAAGDGAACDTLYNVSPIGSGYEEFALTCGGREPENTFGCADAG